MSRPTTRWLAGAGDHADAALGHVTAAAKILVAYCWTAKFMTVGFVYQPGQTHLDIGGRITPRQFEDEWPQCAANADARPE